MRLFTVAMILLSICSMPAFAEVIGQVSTKFKWMGPNDKIVVEVFQDPDIPGIACYLSRAKTGGISGAVGVAEDTSDASLACRQVGPVQIPEQVANGKADGDDVFKKRTSLFTKTMQVVRFYDAPRNTLVYLTYSDRIIEGSPKNSISVVVVTPWSTTLGKTMQPTPQFTSDIPEKTLNKETENIKAALDSTPPRVHFDSSNSD